MASHLQQTDDGVYGAPQPTDLPHTDLRHRRHRSDFAKFLSATGSEDEVGGGGGVLEEWQGSRPRGTTWGRTIFFPLIPSSFFLPFPSSSRQSQLQRRVTHKD
jgi:hypothetical protein